MSIITLTTDLGLKDFYLPKIKMRLMFAVPTYKVVDINNQVAKFDVTQAAFAISSCIDFFPDGTIHIVGVQTDHFDQMDYFVAVYKNQYFIGAKSSAIAHLFDEEPQYIYKIKHEAFEFDSFPTYSILSEIAIKIANKVPLNQWGEVYLGSLASSKFIPTIYNDRIIGNIISIDSFGNAITNIKANLVLEKLKSFRSFELNCSSTNFRTNRISKFYSSVQEADPIAIINTSGYIELAMNKSNAAQLFGLKSTTNVYINFSE